MSYWCNGRLSLLWLLLSLLVTMSRVVWACEQGETKAKLINYEDVKGRCNNAVRHLELSCMREVQAYAKTVNGSCQYLAVPTVKVADTRDFLQFPCGVFSYRASNKDSLRPAIDYPRRVFNLYLLCEWYKNETLCGQGRCKAWAPFCGNRTEPQTYVLEENLQGLYKEATGSCAELFDIQWDEKKEKEVRVRSIVALVLIIVGVVALSVAVTFCCICLCKRRRKKKQAARAASGVPLTVFPVGPGPQYAVAVPEVQGVPSTGHHIPSTGYQIPSTGYQVPSTGYQVPSTGYQVPSTGYQVPSRGHQTPSTGYQVHSMDYSTQWNRSVQQLVSPLQPASAVPQQPQSPQHPSPVAMRALVSEGRYPTQIDHHHPAGGPLQASMSATDSDISWSSIHGRTTDSVTSQYGRDNRIAPRRY